MIVVVIVVVIVIVIVIVLIVVVIVSAWSVPCGKPRWGLVSRWEIDLAALVACSHLEAPQLSALAEELAPPNSKGFKLCFIGQVSTACKDDIRGLNLVSDLWALKTLC